MSKVKAICKVVLTKGHALACMWTRTLCNQTLRKPAEWKCPLHLKVTGALNEGGLRVHYCTHNKIPNLLMWCCLKTPVSKILKHSKLYTSYSMAGLFCWTTEAFILWRKLKELYCSYLKHSGNLCITSFIHYIFPPHEMRTSFPVGAMAMRNECFSLLPGRNLKDWCKNHSGITSYSPAGTLIS